MAKLSFQLIYKDAKRLELERKRNLERGNLRVADRGSSTYLNKNYLMLISLYNVFTKSE